MELHSSATTLKGTTTYFSTLSLKTKGQEKTTKLTDVELDEDVSRALESVDPHVKKPICQFNYGTKAYENVASTTQVIPLLSLTTSAVLKGSSALSDDYSEYLNINEETNVNVDPVDDSNDENEARDDRATKPKTVFKKTGNTFSFFEEGAWAPTTSNRCASTETQPPLRSLYNGQVSFSIIFDTYAKDFDQKKGLKSNIQQGQLNMTQAARIIDRVLCQNIYDDIGFDYRYYNDVADGYRPSGSLLPLWRFRLPGQVAVVTDLKWSTQQPDLFVATFKSESKDGEHIGAVVQFCLKNPSYPEFMKLTKTAALCVSVHSSASHLLAVGFSSGDVAVFDTAAGKKLYKTDFLTKHTRAVSAVCWGEGDEKFFYSSSFDGSVKAWSLMPTCLNATTVVTLSTTITNKTGPDGALLHINDFPYAFTFHPTDTNIFLIGTERGLVFQCSGLHNTDFLFLYKSHDVPVNRIVYNPFIPRYFLTCSSDSTVKIWENMREDPLMVFDVGSAVTDASWSPYTSTVFAVVTTDGRAIVYDLNINRVRPLCEQNVASTRQENIPTKIAFNSYSPIVLIGDEQGSVLTLKLSPNLRVPVKQSKKEWVDPRQLETRKLEKLMSYMKPKSIELPSDALFID